MNDDQLERLLWMATHTVVGIDDADDATFLAARSTIAAMRQPITAEALLADGWTEDTGKYGGTEYRRDIEESIAVVVWFANGRACVNVVHCETRHVELRGAENMHDLRELVRLLGGAK